MSPPTYFYLHLPKKLDTFPPEIASLFILKEIHHLVLLPPGRDLDVRRL